MKGRPKKEDSRDRQYRVRLNSVEDQMLSYASEFFGRHCRIIIIKSAWLNLCQRRIMITMTGDI